MHDRRILHVLGAAALFVCCPLASAANELVVAAESGDLATVNRLVKEQPRLLNAADSSGRFALHAAIARKHLAVMESLLKQSADCRVKDAQGRTAMGLAAQSGSEELAVRMLLNLPDIDLVEAARSGDVDAVALVLAGDHDRIDGRSVNSRWYVPSEFGRPEPPLSEAIAAGQPRVVQLLLAAGARADWSAYRITHAAWLGQINVLRGYVQGGGDVNIITDAWYGTPLFQAACAGRLDVMRFLLDAGAKVNLDADHLTALHGAAWEGQTAAVEALLAVGARIDVAQSFGWRPIHNALWQGHQRIVQLLLDRGAKIDVLIAAGLGRTGDALRLAKEPLPAQFQHSIGPSPAFWAARCGQLETLKALVANDKSLLRFKPQAADYRPKTLLHVAAEADRVEVIRWLIDQYADVDATADGGSFFAMTPLAAAAAAGKIRAAAALLDAGARIEAPTEESKGNRSVAHSGYTPLLAAITENQKEMARFLLDRGADIEAQACQCATPLCEAARQGNKDLCELLLTRGAKLSGRLPTCTPLHAAVAEHPELLEYLIRKGADVNAGLDQGRPPLVAAVQGKQAVASVAILLKHGARLDVPVFEHRESLLMMALKTHQIEPAESLLAAGAKPAQGEWDQVLVSAGGVGDVELVKRLLATGVKLRTAKESQCSDNDIRTVFYTAVSAGHKDLVRFLLTQGCSPEQTDERSLSPLCLAVRSNEKLVALVLLEAGAAVNRAEYPSGDTAMEIATRLGRTRLVRMLLARGATRASRVDQPAVEARSTTSWLTAALLEHPEWLAQFQELSLGRGPINGVRLVDAVSWLALRVQQAKRQRAAVELITSTDGQVRYESGLALSSRTRTGPGASVAATAAGGSVANPPGRKTGIALLAPPRWLRSLLGEDFFYDVDYVWIFANDAGLARLKDLRQLKGISLNYTRLTDAGWSGLMEAPHLRGLAIGRTPVTDARFKDIGKLAQLRELSLGGTEVTDAGLQHLKELAQLEDLYLSGPGITAAGLEPLQGLIHLRRLNLFGFPMTDAGLKNVQGLTQLQVLILGHTQITDAGLEHLKGLTQLRELNLYGDWITDAGLVHLKGLTQLRILTLDATQVTDAGLEHLKGLTQLQRLTFSGTKISYQGVKKLQDVLPNWRVFH